MESYLQSKKETGSYQGHENRSNFALRMVIDKLEELQNQVKKISCKDDCNLGELKNHVGHIDDIIVEKGKGEGRSKGLNNFRDQDLKVEGILKTRSKMIERALLVLAGVGAMYVAKKMGWV
jgi:hypothetical protein